MKTLRWALALFVVLWVLTGVTQIRTEEKAIVRRFGEVVAYWEPGLHVGLPWGIDRIDRIPTKVVRQLRIGYAADQADLAMPIGQLLTADQNLLNVQVAIDYSIDETPQGLTDYLTQRESVDGLIIRAVESSLAEWFSAHRVDDVLLTGNVAIPRWLMSQLPSHLEPFRLGVQVQQASVAYLAPPDAVKSAFDEVNRAQTNIRTLENKAKQEADQRLRIAQAEANRQTQTAEANADEKRRLAMAEAIAFTLRLEQYRRLKQDNPDVLTGIWWDEMGKLLVGMKSRGRIDLLDEKLGADGLDITQFLPPSKGK